MVPVLALTLRAHEKASVTSCNLACRSSPGSPRSLTHWHNPPENLKARHQGQTDIFRFQIDLLRTYYQRQKPSC